METLESAVALIAGAVARQVAASDPALYAKLVAIQKELTPPAPKEPPAPNAK